MKQANNYAVQLRICLIYAVLVLVAAVSPPEISRAAEQGLADNEWYIRLILNAADGRKDSSSVLGLLNSSSRDKDQHDITEMPPPPSPMGDTYLSIVFPHPEWKDILPDYTTDYRAVQGRAGEEERWYFEVRTHTPGIHPFLSWQGPGQVLERSRLEGKEGRVLVENCALTREIQLNIKEEMLGFTWVYTRPQSGKQ